MDGIDAAIFSIKPLSDVPANTLAPLEIKMLGSCLKEFDPAFQKHLKRVIAKGQTTLEQICRLNVALGELFAEAALSAIKAANLAAEDIDLIGSHGQTLWHAPDAGLFWGIQAPSTLQMAESAVIAARTQIPVIADFRPADVAYGGQGAPLVAFADEILFGQQKIATGVLNIGGVANITIVDDYGQAIMAFDTGPGNMILDYAARALFALDYDQNGMLASKGLVSHELLLKLLNHPYFHLTPPKTTGRELFGESLAGEFLELAEEKKLSNYETMATLTALTAHSIVQAYKTFVLPKQKISRLVLGGGGAENICLIEMLRNAWPHEIAIHRHEDFGISTKFKEALLFALLAYTTYFGIPNNVPACTGAKRKTCLGKLTRP
jgi:anhydro-N-acetylmuramic acid kinase